MQCVSLLRACHAAVGSAPHQLLHLLTVGVPDRLLTFLLPVLRTMNVNHATADDRFYRRCSNLYGQLSEQMPFWGSKHLVYARAMYLSIVHSNQDCTLRRTARDPLVARVQQEPATTQQGSLLIGGAADARRGAVVLCWAACKIVRVSLDSAA
jgi:hypothetical protein